MPLLANVNSAATLSDETAPLLFWPMGSGNRKAKVTAENKREAERLRQLWESRSHPSQAEFGELHKIGNQSAVGQFLRGEVPLSLKAAKGFAKGLGCDLRDFSARLAAEAASLQEVSATKPAEVLSFLDLDREEAVLIGLFRKLEDRQRVELQRIANEMYAAKQGEKPSLANPYPTASVPPSPTIKRAMEAAKPKKKDAR